MLRTEGHDGKRWVLLDYGSVIVHVFTQEAHDYYDLEHLWADATVVPASEWMPETDEPNGFPLGRIDFPAPINGKHPFKAAFGGCDQRWGEKTHQKLCGEKL